MAAAKAATTTSAAAAPSGLYYRSIQAEKQNKKIHCALEFMGTLFMEHIAEDNMCAID